MLFAMKLRCYVRYVACLLSDMYIYVHTASTHYTHILWLNLTNIIIRKRRHIQTDKLTILCFRPTSEKHLQQDELSGCSRSRMRKRNAPAIASSN